MSHLLQDTGMDVDPDASVGHMLSLLVTDGHANLCCYHVKRIWMEQD